MYNHEMSNDSSHGKLHKTETLNTILVKEIVSHNNTYEHGCFKIKSFALDKSEMLTPAARWVILAFPDLCCNESM